MTNRLIYLLVTIAPMTLTAQGQDSKKEFTADSIFIYQSFRQGGTTANLSHNHRDLDSTKTEIIKLSSRDMTDFIDIFRRAKSKKLFQQKYGAGLCYLLVFRGGQRFRYIIYSSPDIGILDNLVLMRRWTVNDISDNKRLYDLIQKTRHNKMHMPLPGFRVNL